MRRLVIRYITEEGLEGKASFRIPNKEELNTDVFIDFLDAVNSFNNLLKKKNIQVTRSIEDDA